MATAVARASASGLDGRLGWTAVLGGPAGSHDAVADVPWPESQGDLVGDARHGTLLVSYDPGATGSSVDDRLGFRVRLGSAAPVTGWAGLVVVGLDANGDGRLDLFMAWDGTGDAPQVRLLDPGTTPGDSPNTTRTALLPTGWLPSGGIHPATPDTAWVQPVTSANDPQWDGNAHLGRDSGTDTFIAWSVPVWELQAALAKPSPVDAQGRVGPRGSTGIPDIGPASRVRYVAFTQTRLGSLDGDVSGVALGFDRNASWDALGAFSLPVSLGEPRGPFSEVRIDQPIDADGVLNASEDAAVALAGDAPALGWVKVTVSDAGSARQVAWVQADAQGRWQTVRNLSPLAEGALTIMAESVAADGASETVPGTVPAMAAVRHDREPPRLTLDPVDTLGTPTFRGTSDLPDGGIVALELDHDHRPETVSLGYLALVRSGAWSLDTAVAAPVSGTWPAGGLPANARITARAIDAAGNPVTVVGLTRPTVHPVVSRSLSPVLSGTWVREAADLLTVTVGGVTYSVSAANDAWTLDLATAIPVEGTLSLGVGAPMEVQARVSRGAASATDASSGELTLLPPVALSVDGGGSASGIGAWPIVTGGSSEAGGFVVVRIDPGNDADLSDAVTYATATDAGGRWTIDTATASPILGTPDAITGFLGVNGIRVSDARGLSSAVQVLTGSSQGLTIDVIRSDAVSDAWALVDNAGSGATWLNATEDNRVRITGTATGTGVVDLTVADPMGHAVAVAGLPIVAGAWSTAALDLSTLEEGVLTVTATIRGTTVTAVDARVTHDTLAPRIAITSPSDLKKNPAVVIGVSEWPLKPLVVTLRNSADTANLCPPVTVTTLASGEFSASLSPGNVSSALVKVAPAAQETDAAGNLVQGVQKLQAISPQTSTKMLAFHAIAADQRISSDEVTGGLALAGTTTLTGSGSVQVTVTDGVATQTVSGVHSGGGWTATVSASQIRALANGVLTFTVSASDGSVVVQGAAFARLALDSPRWVLSGDVAGTATGNVTFFFNASEGVGGFDAADIVVVGGIPGAFTRSTDSLYSLVVVPPPSSQGTLEISIPDRAAQGLVSRRDSVPATLRQAFDTRIPVGAPSLTIDTGTLVQDATPRISGTTSLPPGLPLEVRVDVDNDGVDDLTYGTGVSWDGRWALDLGTDLPRSGRFPDQGLEPSARITAIAEHPARGTTTVVGLNRPTVEARISRTHRPTLTGRWTRIAGDSLQVTVGGRTFSGPALTVDATGWSVAVDSDLSEGVHEVVASVIRSGGDRVQDPSALELVVDTTAAITLAGGADEDQTPDTTPVLAGTTVGIPAGAWVDLILAPEAWPGESIRYRVPVGDDGRWAVAVGDASPESGWVPVGGLSGWTRIVASVSDAAGNVATDEQRLRVDPTPPSLTLTFNPITAETRPWISGLSDLPAGAMLQVSVDPNHDGLWEDALSATASVVQGGAWSVQIGTPVSGTVGVRASAQDEIGNLTITPVKVLRVDPSAPGLGIDPLPAAPGQIYADGRVDELEDSAVLITGSTIGWDLGGEIEVRLADGSQTWSGSARVGNDGSWASGPWNLRGMAWGWIRVSAWSVRSDGGVFVAERSFLHDRGSWASPTVDRLSEDTGLRGDFVTAHPSPAVLGTATPGGTVDVSLIADSGATILAPTRVAVPVHGGWSLAMPALSDGRYTIRATSPGGVAEQGLVIDTQPPRGPVTVTDQTTDRSTPVVTGRVVLAAEESFSVTLDGVVYRPGDGGLALSGEAWSLEIPLRNLLRPAETGGGFSGIYEVVARIEDRAGNPLTDGTRGELVLRDLEPPVLDLAPSDPTTLDQVRVVVPGLPLALVDETDAAILGDNSGRIRSLEVSVLDLRDGASELLQLGESSFPANGSSGARRNTRIGDVTVDIWFRAGLFSIFRSDGPTFSAAEAERVLRAIRYVPAAGVATPGDRRVVLRAIDPARNSSVPATVTCRVPGPVDRFEVVPDASQAVAGAAVVITARAVDAGGTPVLLGGRRVAWSQGGTPGVLGASMGVLDDQGRASVSLVLPTRSGVWTEVVAVDPDQPSITGISARVVTVAGPAHRLAFRDEPTDTVAGIAIHPSPSVRENTATVATYTASEPVTWSVFGGADAARFTMNVGALGFASPPDFEAPSDADGNNAYVVVLRATDVAGNTTDRAITVTVNDLDEVAPEVAGPTAPSVHESTTTVATYSANEPVIWSVTGGADAGRFVVANGLLSFATPPDFEAPSDADVNNTYVVVLRATEVAGNTTDRAITVTVSDVDEVAPEIAGPTVPLVRENATTVATYTASEPVTWSLAGGPDATRFSIDDGTLRFLAPLDFEAPSDVDRNNTYLLVLRTTDTAGNTTDRAITVTVVDENEPPRFTAPIPGLLAIYRQEFQWFLPPAAFLDPDAAQMHRWTLYGLPRGLTFDPQTRSVRGAPEQIGEFPLTLVVSDSGIPSKTNTTGLHLRVRPAQAFLTLSRLEQTYDGQPKRVEVSTDPDGLEVEVTYSGSRVPPTLPGRYPVVAFLRDPNVAGLVAGTLVISGIGYSLLLHQPVSMVLEEDSGAGVVVPTGEDLVEVFGPDGRRLDAEILRERRLSVNLLFRSLPKDEQGRVRGHVERFQRGLWTRVPMPTEASPLVVPIAEWEAGLVAYVPDPHENGRCLARWLFDAELVDPSGEPLAMDSGGRMDLSVRNVPDAPEAVLEPVVSLAHREGIILGLHHLFRDRDPESSRSLRFQIERSDVGIEARISGDDLQIISDSTEPVTGHLTVVAADPQGLEARLNLTVTSLGRVARTHRVPLLSMEVPSEDGGVPGRRVASGSGSLVCLQPENRFPVARFEALGSEGDRVEFGLIGPDAPLFTIDGDGWLRARRLLDFEDPMDQERTGRFRLAVTAQDGRGGQRIQPLEILVTNVEEDPEPRAGQVPPWLMPRPSTDREYRISDGFVDPEGGSLSASIRNTDALLKLGVEASLDGDRLRLRCVGDGPFPPQAMLRLALEARGRVREMEVPLLSDFDDDGIDDLTESLAGDLDQDGIPDANQGSVASFPSRMRGGSGDSGGADPASFLCLIVDGNPSMSRLLHPRWDVVPAGIIAEWRAALASRGIRDLRLQGGLLGYTLETGAKVSDPVGRLRSVPATQHRVRVLLPAGIHVNSCIKTDANGVPYEFLKAPLLDGSGNPRTDDAGRALFTGAEFRPSAVAGIPDEVWIHLVDNERGDDDPTPGRILDPGVLAEVDRSVGPATPRIDLPASPASASAMALEGSAGPGATVRLWESGWLQAEVRADALGRWRWQPVSSPEAGLHRYAVSAREVSGEESSRSAQSWVVVETTPGNPSVDPRPVVAPSLTLGAGGLRMRLPAVAGKRFRVLAASSMVPPVDWQELGRAQADPDGSLWWVDPKVLEPRRFYRIEPVEAP